MPKKAGSQAPARILTAPFAAFDSGQQQPEAATPETPAVADSNLYDTETRKAIAIPEDKLNQALLSGTASYKTGARINVVDGDGKSYNVAGEDVTKALQQGYQLESPRQQAVREYVKENKGVGGAAKVALEQFANQALFSIPETIYEKTGDPLEVAKYEALKKEHNIANAIGGVAGFGANLAAGGPVFGAAKAAGRGVEAALAARLAANGVERGSQAIARGILEKTMTSAAKMGVEGAVIAAPKAITEELLGDHELAAETMLFGVGAGAALGGIGAATGHLAGKVGKIGTSFVQGFQEGANDMATELGPEAQKLLSEKLASHVVQKTGKFIGSGIGAVVGGVIGHVPGAFVGHHLGEYAGNYLAEKAGPLIAEQAMKLAATNLDTIPGLLEGLANKGFQSSSRVASNAFTKFSNLHDDDKDAHESFERMSQNLASLTTQPELLAGNVGTVTNPIVQSAPQIAEQYTAKQLAAIQFLQAEIPKPPREPRPFTDNTWKPSDQQLRTFQRKLEIVADPFAVLGHLQAGTLSNDHVRTLNAVYPKLRTTIRDRILDKAFEPTLKRMPSRVKQKLSLLTDMPMMDQNLPALQANFSSSEPDGGSHNAPSMPSPQTDTQRLTSA